VSWLEEIAPAWVRFPPANWNACDEFESVETYGVAPRHVVLASVARL